MRGVNLHHFSSGLERSLRGICKSLSDFRDSNVVKLLRDLIAISEWQRTRGEDRSPASVGDTDRVAALPRLIRARFPPGMRQLHAGNSTLRLNKLKNPRQHFGLFIFPDPKVLRADPPIGRTAAASVKTSAAPPTARLPR